MAAIRDIHEYMTTRQSVVLDDGRTGRIVRVDTSFPQRATTVSVWTPSPRRGPTVAKVDISRIVGPSRVA